MAAALSSDMSKLLGLNKLLHGLVATCLTAGGGIAPASPFSVTENGSCRIL